MTEPSVRNPQLRELVDLARAQRVPEVRATYGDIQRGVEAEEKRRRGLLVAGVVAVAAVALAWFLVGSPGRWELAASDATPSQAAKTKQGGGEHETVERQPPRRLEPAEVVETPEPEPEPEPALDVESGGEDELSSPPFGPEFAPSPDGAQGRTPSAAELSRDAERALAAGRTREAIRLLSTLVRKHPRSAHSRAGLIDLARLHKSVGSQDRARCAYKLYLDRFPGAKLRPDVERALDKLGEGRGCRGLAPR